MYDDLYKRFPKPMEQTKPEKICYSKQFHKTIARPVQPSGHGQNDCQRRHFGYWPEAVTEFGELIVYTQVIYNLVDPTDGGVMKLVQNPIKSLFLQIICAQVSCILLVGVELQVTKTQQRWAPSTTR